MYVQIRGWHERDYDSDSTWDGCRQRWRSKKNFSINEPICVNFVMNILIYTNFPGYNQAKRRSNLIEQNMQAVIADHKDGTFMTGCRL